MQDYPSNFADGLRKWWDGGFPFGRAFWGFFIIGTVICGALTSLMANSLAAHGQLFLAGWGKVAVCLGTQP